VQINFKNFGDIDHAWIVGIIGHLWVNVLNLMSFEKSIHVNIMLVILVTLCIYDIINCILIL